MSTETVEEVSFISPREKCWKTKFSLSSLSDRTLAILAAVCLVTFIALVSVIVEASSPTNCTGGQHGEKSLELLDISGVYQLEEVENYGEYLLAMDIPERAVRHMEKLKTEIIRIKILGEEEIGVNLKTVTSWATREIEFNFSSHFNLTYGDQGRGGVLGYYCTRPQHNVINCRSFEEKKNWEIVFDFIFTVEGLINQSYFITKHIGMKKKYKKKR